MNDESAQQTNDNSPTIDPAPTTGKDAFPAITSSFATQPHQRGKRKRKSLLQSLRRGDIALGLVVIAWLIRLIHWVIIDTGGSDYDLVFSWPMLTAVVISVAFLAVGLLFSLVALVTKSGTGSAISAVILVLFHLVFVFRQTLSNLL